MTDGILSLGLLDTDIDALLRTLRTRHARSPVRMEMEMVSPGMAGMHPATFIANVERYNELLDTNSCLVGWSGVTKCGCTSLQSSLSTVRVMKVNTLILEGLIDANALPTAIRK